MGKKTLANAHFPHIFAVDNRDQMQLDNVQKNLLELTPVEIIDLLHSCV